MDTLDGTEWDVVIAGTGLPQSLLALCLSRSGKNILHVDRNDYYGGDEAALSLAEAEGWAARHSSTGDGSRSSVFSHVAVTKPEVEEEGVKLSQPRAYSLALAPQVVHAQSKLLPTLVSSRIHNQLDFQAVGSWFVLEPSSTEAGTRSRVTRVPSSREDVFQDTSFDLRAKRSLMKFLRFVGNHEEQSETWADSAESPFSDFLEQKFGLLPSSHAPLLALTMAPGAVQDTSTSFALPRIARHLRSIGLFGPGFGAVLPKWGGLAEIVQVACRAGAVGGGVYVLKKGIASKSSEAEDKTSLVLSDGEKVSTKWLAGCSEEIPSSNSAATSTPKATTGLTRAITIVSSRLTSLYPPTSEGGVTPAGAVIVVPSTGKDEPPVHIIAHSSDSGECPSTQCVLYTSTAQPFEEGSRRLTAAVDSLLTGIGENPPPRVLWSMQYYQQFLQPQPPGDGEKNVVILPPVSLDLALPDTLLDDVKTAWQTITGEIDDAFLKFEVREGAEDEDGF